jgi:release factor glutamine methyltransferase
MKYKDLKALYINELKGLYDEEESAGLFYITLSKLTGSSRIQYLEQQQNLVEQNSLDNFHNILAQLKLGKPIQYILEEAHFYGLRFKVSPDVLIPRDETEELVDLIIRDVRSAPEISKTLLDIGTGSGCIAISLKSKIDWLQVAVLDVSAGALAIAKENANVHQLPIEFIEADVLTYETTNKFDIIVSNPPYIREDEKEAMSINVLEHEPHTALFVSNEDPLIFYKAIATLALKSLNPSGRLYFEINEHLGPEMIEMARGMGFRHIQLIKDMQQKDRILRCQF